MKAILFKNGRLLNEGRIQEADLLVKNGRIEKIGTIGTVAYDHETIELNGKLLMPGVIDDQVHFREPGLTHKANIATESAASLAGGVTSYMEMPNTSPPATTQTLLEDKYRIAAASSFANYSFYMGASNDNLEEVLKTNPNNVCGVKAFMGSSTGNMLVDNVQVLEGLFSRCPMLIATHCEDEGTVRKNIAEFREKYGSEGTAELHPLIRSVEACYLSSSMAVGLAKRFGTRLHVLHISTEKELELFEPGDRNHKRITAEVCVHHLTFSSDDYPSLGNLIKCNPAIKNVADRDALWKALTEDRLDIIATDHAPHTMEEKQSNYFDAPSGLPLIQHTLNMMMNHVADGRITLEKMVDKMCHAPADLFKIVDRGYLREGYMADLVVVDPEAIWEVKKDQLLYKCGWSPLEGRAMNGRIESTWLNGQLAFDGSKVLPVRGQRLTFHPK